MLRNCNTVMTKQKVASEPDDIKQNEELKTNCYSNKIETENNILMGKTSNVMSGGWTGLGQSPMRTPTHSDSRNKNNISGVKCLFGKIKHKKTPVKVFM